MNSIHHTIDTEKLEAFLGLVTQDLSAINAGFMTHLGHTLGLYRGLAGAGPLSAAELAERTGCDKRYTREWLNSQAAGNYVSYCPRTDTFTLPDEHALVLCDEDGPCFLPPALQVAASMWFDEDRLLQAFRSGEGVPWGDHNERLFCGVAAFFRSGYLANLCQHWLPALDGVVTKLKKGARVADIGCGQGHASIIMAKAFPNSVFFGYDTHAESITVARANAKAEGVDQQLEFQVASAKAIKEQNFDLICFLDCLHDMGDPVGAAARARELLQENGTLMLVEPFAGDHVEDNLNPVGRLFYSASTVLCCAHSKSEEVGMALGAQAGEKQLTAVLKEAGFSDCRRATETPFNLVIEAQP